VNAVSHGFISRVTPEELTALFARRLHAFARHDASSLAADYCENCVLESSSQGTVQGRASIEKITRQWFSAFPDLSLESHDVLAIRDRVVQTATVRGTDTGGFLGQVPTNKAFEIFLVILYTFHNGQIAHERRVYDLHSVMLQLATNRSSVAEAAQAYRATLERAHMERELAIAASIQRALLPELRRKASGFELAAMSVPCRAIGGDFFDYFDLSNEAFGFALGDVAGKGPPAALLAAELQGVLAAYSHLEGTPADTVGRINQVLVRRPVESRFATMLYAQLSGGGRLTYCNAGHNAPFIVGKRGVQRLEKGGLILGAFPAAVFEEDTVQLDPDDVLVVFSDGVTEALDPSGNEFGEDRLSSAITDDSGSTAATVLEHLLTTVHEFTAGAAQADDVTVLVLRYTGS
jgi:serine phosphatase RsbU (regulator of sigma subunit)